MGAAVPGQDGPARAAGVGPARAARVLKAWGVQAREKLMGDPYALAREVKGIGFRTADEIALKVGLAPDSPQRLGAALSEALREAAGEGHTALPREEVLARVARMTSTMDGAAAGTVERELTDGR